MHTRMRTSVRRYVTDNVYCMTTLLHFRRPVRACCWRAGVVAVTSGEFREQEAEPEQMRRVLQRERRTNKLEMSQAKVRMNGMWTVAEIIRQSKTLQTRNVHTDGNVHST